MINRTVRESDILEVDGWLRLKVTTGQFSKLLVQQLARGMVDRSLHVHTIYDEIGALEGAQFSKPTNTKSPTPFNHAPLKGLMHKHYTTPAHIIKNIDNYWGKGFAHFNRFVKEQILRGQESVELTEEVIGRMAQGLVMNAFEERNLNKKMTGEWIVYASEGGVNYYLTLGDHGEYNETIAERVRSCASDFPHLNLEKYV
jgi:hypothetical protein